MRYHVTIRGQTWSLQDRVPANNPDEALTYVCEKWGIERGDLKRIHVQEDDGRPEQP